MCMTVTRFKGGDYTYKSAMSISTLAKLVRACSVWSEQHVEPHDSNQRDFRSDGCIPRLYTVPYMLCILRIHKAIGRLSQETEHFALMLFTRAK